MRKTEKNTKKAAVKSVQKTDLTSPRNYFNRELSFLEFNNRVLNEAELKEHPLLERLKFVSIFSSNLDEFFMIRIAGLKGQIQAGVVELSMDGMTPEEQFSEIRKRLVVMYGRQQDILLNQIIPELEENDVHFHDLKNLTSSHSTLS